MVQTGTVFQLYLIKKLHQITAIRLAKQYGLKLYLIKKLHQITAINSRFISLILLYLIKKLHQITAVIFIYRPAY